MFGSAGLSCAYVASGKCDFYAEKGVYFWDFAAGVCLVKRLEEKLIMKKSVKILIQSSYQMENYEDCHCC